MVLHSKIAEFEITIDPESCHLIVISHFGNKTIPTFDGTLKNLELLSLVLAFQVGTDVAKEFLELTNAHAYPDLWTLGEKR